MQLLLFSLADSDSKSQNRGIGKLRNNMDIYETTWIDMTRSDGKHAEIRLTPYLGTARKGCNSQQRNSC